MGSPPDPKYIKPTIECSIWLLAEISQIYRIKQ